MVREFSDYDYQWFHGGKPKSHLRFRVCNTRSGNIGDGNVRRTRNWPSSLKYDVRHNPKPDHCRCGSRALKLNLLNLVASDAQPASDDIQIIRAFQRTKPLFLKAEAHSFTLTQLLKNDEMNLLIMKITLGFMIKR